jgi:hypothetical protein
MDSSEPHASDRTEAEAEAAAAAALDAAGKAEAAAEISPLQVRPYVLMPL